MIAFRSMLLPVLALILAVADVGASQVINVDHVADSIRQSIDGATGSGELKRLEEAIALCDRAVSASPDSRILLHYQAFALYRAASLTIDLGHKDKARPYLDRARSILEFLTSGETIVESYALLSSVYGLQILASRIPAIAGMQLGSRSKNAIDKAVAIAPQNPRVVLVQGINDVITPAAFGGGSDKAVAHLKQAIVLFADDHPASPLPAWGLADAHVWLGQTFAKQKKAEAARAEYEVALALQPQNKWITDVLIPALAKGGRE